MSTSPVPSSKYSSVDLRPAKSKDQPEPVGEHYDVEGGIPRVPTRHSEKAVDSEDFLVKWKDGDPENPYNWPTSKKAFITFVLGMLALAGSGASAIIAPGQEAIAAEFGIHGQVTVLTVSLYVTAFIIGPCIWAPISELYGRRVSLLPAVFCLGIFSIATAVSKNTASILVTRFIGGIFGAAPVANVAAALGDIWMPRVRGTAMSLYAICVVSGATVFPAIGGVLVEKASWRWTEYFQAIFTFAACILAYFGLPEVYAPYLLRCRAVKLRKETGDSRWFHPHEKVRDEVNFQSIFTKHFARPIRMLLTEPMITCIAMYASFIFGLLYMSLQFLPIVYHDIRGWSTAVSSTSFAALFVGVLCALFINLANQPRYARVLEANGGKPVPEGRLLPMFIGSVLLVIGLFMFGWTADPSIPWPPSIIAVGFIGAGFNTAFQNCINYLVDTYRLYAASATSANTFLRSILAAALPFAAAPMFNRLGPGPSCSILGGLATLALPMPIVFMKYGLKLRRKSKFAPVDE